jgi:methyl-accepting chemotaxis protein
MPYRSCASVLVSPLVSPWCCCWRCWPLPVALVNARANAQATRAMMEQPLAKERLVSDWYVLIYSAIARTALIARSSDEKLSDTFAEVIAGSTKRGSELLGKIKELLVTDEERKIYEEITELRNKYQKAKTDVMNARKAGDAARAEQLFKDAFSPSADAYQNRVKDFLGMQRKAIDDTAHAIDDANSRANALLLLLAVLMVSGSVAGMDHLALHHRAAKSAVDIAATVANGDLTTQFSSQTNKTKSAI